MNFRKIALIIFALLVVLFIIGSFAGDTSSDGTKITAMVNNSSFNYYGPDTSVGKEGYTYSVTVNGSGTYYFDDTIAEKLGTQGYHLKQIIAWDLNTNYAHKLQTITPKDILGNNIEALRPGNYDLFSWQNLYDNFTFTYHNETIGANEHGHVISKVYYTNGTEIPSPK